MKTTFKNRLLFFIPSLTGIALFMIPVKWDGGWTIAVKILADAIALAAGGILPALCLAILTVSAAVSVLYLVRPSWFDKRPLLKSTFSASPIWVAIRVAGAVFCWITFTADPEGPLEIIAGADQGTFILYDLLCTLVIIFAIAGLLLPLLLDFGLLEFVGALLTKWMRPLFKIPGRAAVDCITSWIGDGTLGVMLTCSQYEQGYYSAREAAVIATTFSAVSITFSLVVLNQVGLIEYFGAYYLIICIICVCCAIICPRLWPLCRKKDTYLVEGKKMPETVPAEYKNTVQYGMALAMKRVSEHKGIGEFISNGCRNSAQMWFGVLPTVMCIGTVALAVANYTPVFEWLGIPFRPLLSVLQVPDVNEAASTMIVGFVDMFTPSILIAGTDACSITRFIVAVISVTQVLYLSEVGGLILASKLPLNLPEMFIIFLERTIISLLVVCPAAHLLF